MSIRVAQSVALLVVAVACASAAQPRQPKAASKSMANRQLKPKVQCSSLAGKDIPASKIALPTNGATIKSAELKPATGPDVLPADMVPEYCNVEGAIAPIDPAAPPINFRVAIPTVWNGKSFQIGGNGRDGFIPNLAWLARNKPGSPIGPAFPPNRQFPIAQGYATYGSDSGHGGALPPDQTVAGPVAGGEGVPPAQRGGEGIPQGVPGRGRGRGGNPQAEAWNTNDEAYKNFAYAAIKKTHDVAMEIIFQMYATRPAVNYFTGESQGGREALAALTHYPADYDGVIASVPLAYYTGTRLSRVALWAKTQAAPGAWLPPAKAPALSREVLRRCDALDGLEDGVISNYYACNRIFDGNPDAIAKIRCPDGADTGNDCLSDAQIATWNMYHSPMKWGFPMNDGETEWPAEPVGAEASPQYILLGRKPDPVPGAGDLLTERYGDPEKNNVTTHTFAEMKDNLQSLSADIDVSSDWSKYLARGGKLIFYTGGDDYTTNARTQMHLYEAVVKRLGQSNVDKFVRYYVAPNVNHGSIGVSATTGKPLPRYTDMLTYLQDWVEKGVTPPDALTQTLMADKPPYAVERSRPICRYPNYPRYKGAGDPDKIESYACAAP